MQRWFFLEDAEKTQTRDHKDESQNESLKSSSQLIYRKWLFKVCASDLKPDETVCVTGSCDELGAWYPDKCVPLLKQESDIWSISLDIPDKKHISYRFCVCVVIEPGLQVIVRHWETAIQCRDIDSDAISPRESDDPLSYGHTQNYYKVDRGWLNKETVVQLKLCNNPLTLWRPKYLNRRVYIKVTPVTLQHHLSGLTSNSVIIDDSLSADTLEDTGEGPKHSYTEVASLQDEDPRFNSQGQFGKEYHDDEMLIFQSTLLFPNNIAFLIDLYIYSSRCSEGEPPYHAGFSYLLPSALQQSEGTAVLPVTSTKHRPLGQIRIDYLVIKPLPFPCDMSTTYQRHWNRRRAGLDVGHRGSGSSFKTKNCAEVRENTIASLKNAIHFGADYVEFDVQLSKDMIPIIYHDFHVCIAMKKKNNMSETDMLELPVKELTFEQLRMLKVYHLTEGKSKNPRFFDDEQEEHQPFPTLQQVLEVLNPHVGFNIEIKWTMQFHDGSYELYHPTDLNLYLDTILEVVLKYGGNRRIVFSCFNADCCTMIRMKQNKYPVMFLTQGETILYPRYYDPRCWSINSAAQYATMIEMLGINVHTEDLLREPSLIKCAVDKDLIIFCWGDDNSNPDTIKFLKELGLHGVIYDKMYQYNSKEIKESIFLAEARDSQKALLIVAAQNAENPTSPPPPVNITGDTKFDIEKIRQNMDDMMSTATSLESLESRVSEYDKI
ncbi:hypothetical protein WA026_000692 [Henosepilachna vigintioctopunctata]|uniref:Glycerophosphocholine phosphodiesterase GPCPD1 n=1 Tax=Henosepilachna vigintioctopunctata TaxID=420089 RepID=A0AAW1V5R1_9CUCU